MTKQLMTQKFIREEEDGTTTSTYATNCNGKYKTHNSKGPAIVNKKQGLIHKIEEKQDITRSFLIIEYLDVLAKSKEQSSTLSVAKATLDSLAHISGIWIDKKQLDVSGAVNHLASLDTGTLIDALSVATTSDADPDAETVAINGEYRNVADA